MVILLRKAFQKLSLAGSRKTVSKKSFGINVIDGIHLLLRSSRPKVFCKKGVLKNFAKFNFPVNFVKFFRTPFL